MGQQVRGALSRADRRVAVGVWQRLALQPGHGQHQLWPLGRRVSEQRHYRHQLRLEQRLRVQGQQRPGLRLAVLLVGAHKRLFRQSRRRRVLWGRGRVG